MHTRIEHIDIAKGIAITSVALSHSALQWRLPVTMVAISLYMVPLFFFLSGVFFSAATSPKLFLTKKSESLLKPYFSVLIVAYVLYGFINVPTNEWKYFGIFYGNGHTISWPPLWFITNLFAAQCFSYILFRCTAFNQCKTYIKWMVLFAFLTIGTLNIDLFMNAKLSAFGRLYELPGLPFSIDVILVTSAFFIAGALLKEKTINFKINNLLLFFSTIIFIYISFFTDASINIHRRIYANPALSSIGAICGMYAVMCLSSLIKKMKVGNIFMYLGSASLFILLFHRFIDRQAYGFLKRFVENNSHEALLLGIFTLLLGITLSLVVHWVANRNDFVALFFFPFKSNKLLQRARRGNA